MNIFQFSTNPTECAQWHCDKHILSQLKESCQILSTAHRFLDGHEVITIVNNRRKKEYKLDDVAKDELLYKATHINHGSTAWARKSPSNYLWLHSLAVELCKEYTHRYNKIHKCEWSGLVKALAELPKNIVVGELTTVTPVMPEQYIVVGDSVSSYRNYFNGSKQHLAAWKNRDVPEWFVCN
jgi:hypothetical protein